MKKAVLAAAVLLLAAVTAANSAAATAPAQTSRFTSSISNVQLPGRDYDLNHNIGEFGPGAALPRQSCTCDVYFSVIEGELTVTIGDKIQVYGSGTSGYIPAGPYQEQTSKGTKARVFYTMIQLARGADKWDMNPAPGASMPAVMPNFVGWATSLGLHTTADRVTILQDISDWDAGFKTPLHVMNHDHVFSVLEGENTVRYQDGDVERFTAGQQFVMTVGRPGTMENSGATNNRLAMTMVLASSAPPFSPLETPPQPAVIAPAPTGDAGLASAPETAPTGWAYAAAAFGVLGAGALTFVLAGRRRPRQLKQSR